MQEVDEETSSGEETGNGSEDEEDSGDVEEEVIGKGKEKAKVCDPQVFGIYLLLVKDMGESEDTHETIEEEQGTNVCESHR
jgi:hypothetical protein